MVPFNIMGCTRLRVPIAEETFLQIFVFRPRKMGINGKTRRFGKASLSSVNVFADNVRLVSSANILGIFLVQRWGDR